MIRIILIAFITLSLTACTIREHSGKIIDKVYKPASTGIGTSSKGTAVITSDFAAHIVVIEEADGNIIEANVNKDIYYKKNIGDTIIIKRLEL